MSDFVNNYRCKIRKCAIHLDDSVSTLSQHIAIINERLQCQQNQSGKNLIDHSLLGPTEIDQSISLSSIFPSFYGSTSNPQGNGSSAEQITSRLIELRHRINHLSSKLSGLRSMESEYTRVKDEQTKIKAATSKLATVLRNTELLKSQIGCGNQNVGSELGDPSLSVIVPKCYLAPAPHTLSFHSSTELNENNSALQATLEIPIDFSQSTLAHYSQDSQADPNKNNPQHNSGSFKENILLNNLTTTNKVNLTKYRERHGSRATKPLDNLENLSSLESLGLSEETMELLRSNKY